MTSDLFQLKEGEETLLKERTIWIRGKVNNPFGFLMLTNQRLILQKMSFFEKISATQFGIIGALIYGLIGLIYRNKKVEVLLDLPLKDISLMEPTTYALNKKVILVHTLSMGELKLGVMSKPEVWIEKFEGLRKKK